MFVKNKFSSNYKKAYPDVQEGIYLYILLINIKIMMLKIEILLKLLIKTIINYN